MKAIKYTTRDLLWAMAIVAVAASWFVNRQQLLGVNRKVSEENQSLRDSKATLSKAIREVWSKAYGQELPHIDGEFMEKQ